MTSHRFTAACLAVCLGLLAPAAMAQDAVLSNSEEAAAPAYTWFGDAIFRYEHTDHLPGARYAHPLTRERARVRGGVLWQAMPNLEFGAAVELGAGSASNRDNRINNDNA